MRQPYQKPGVSTSGFLLPTMQYQALSRGDAVPHENFDAVIQSVFNTAVNFRLTEEERLITLFVSEKHELPQGIRLGREIHFPQTLIPGLRVAARGGILRFDSSPLRVDFRGASVWKSCIPELSLDVRSVVVQQAWLTAWDILNREQKHKNSEILANDFYKPAMGSPLCQRMSKLVTSLTTLTRRRDLPGILCAAEQIIGLGPGVTPSGDDFLVGFLAGLWSMVGRNKEYLEFVRCLGIELIQLAKRTNEISRTYILHAAQGQFSSGLSFLAEALATGNAVEDATHNAMRVGHSSGMDMVTGLLIALSMWNRNSLFIPDLSGRMKK